jgi:hypothetical protein
MDVDVSGLFASFLVSGIGFVLFSYGRKMSRPPQVVSGLVLMIFPYFVSNLWLEASITLAILGSLFLAVKQGW